MDFNPTGVTSLVLELLLLVGRCDKRGHPGEFYKVLVDGYVAVQCPVNEGNVAADQLC